MLKANSQTSNQSNHRLQRLTLPAPAKLNLFLHITGRRDDGYHLLQTVFQMLDYADEIELSLTQCGEIIRTENSDAQALGIPYESDLCVRAAKLLQPYQRTHQKNQAKQTQSTNNQSALGVEIKLHKVLPIGGGIGGGSSNAATVLHGLNILWDCQLSMDELAELGLQLGADVPVFVRARSAWAEGVGEKLTPLNLPEKWFVVLHPNIFASTAKIFADQGLTRDCDTLKIARFLQGDQFNFLSENYRNVFEVIVAKQYPEIAQAIEWLSAYSPARLTGTGSCVFAAFDSENEASKVLQALQQSRYDWQAFVAKGLNQSPLLTVIDDIVE